MNLFFNIKILTQRYENRRENLIEINLKKTTYKPIHNNQYLVYSNQPQDHIFVLQDIFHKFVYNLFHKFQVDKFSHIFCPNNQDCRD